MDNNNEIRDFNPYQKKKARDSYASLVSRIKNLYGDEITNREAHDAARNLLAFCQEMLDGKLMQHKLEKEYKEAQKAHGA